MTVEDLADLLQLMPLRQGAFDLGWDGRTWEVHALRQDPDGWHVFYAERGLRSGEAVFADESEACLELLRRLSRDKTVWSL